MEHLIKDAANEFQCHNYATALSLYKRCVQKCQLSDHPIYILNNLKSSVAALETIMGNLDEALKILNEVLTEDKQHWLSLMRRSQVYKKKMEFKKSMKDLQIMSMYAPDNLHVAALKLQIKGLMSKKGESSSEEEEDAQNEDLDEQEMLQFSNLRKIDRTSVSIMLTKGRQSRVTICGDIAIEYDIDEQMERDEESYLYSPKIVKQRFIEISKQIEEDETQVSEVEQSTPVIKVRPVERTKSILKNRDSQLFITTEKPKNTTGEAEKMINKLLDIEGKVIKSETSSESRPSKEVNFRKSLFGSQEKQIIIQVIPKKAQKHQRKSCLKRSSFAFDQAEQKKQPRRSKFQVMQRDSIDGKFIKGSKERVQNEKENFREEKDDSDEEGSQYNIYGNQQVNISKELRQNLGLSSEDDFFSGKKGGKKERGKSILKKNSVFVEKKKVSIFGGSSFNEQEKEKKEKKAKKSVMFKNY